jgi:hypothetical protein
MPSSLDAWKTVGLLLIYQSPAQQSGHRNSHLGEVVETFLKGVILQASAQSMGGNRLIVSFG